MAKGGLTPDHVLITPIGHHQSQVSSPPEVIDDVRQYVTALKKHFRKQGKAVVTFERNYKTQHMQVQVGDHVTNIYILITRPSTLHNTALLWNVNVDKQLGTMISV